MWAVLIVAFFNGAYANLYPYVLIHKPKAYLYPLVVGSAILGPAYATWLAYIADAYPAKFSPRYGTVFAAQGIMLAVIASYICFISFTRQQASEALRIQNELDLAHGIQRTLVPPLRTVSSGFELNGISLPSDKVGGDLVDVVPLVSGATLAYVADVSGHGLQAGILMGMVKTAIRTILLEDFATPELLLHALCDRLNRALPGVKEAHMYATLSAVHLAPGGSVSYILAGHPPILHLDSATGSVESLGGEEFPVGLIPVSSYHTYSISLQPGDILAISTDGILEATDSKDEEFGSARVGALIAKTRQGGQQLTMPEALEETSQSIFKAVRAFGLQADDQTLLLIRRQVLHP